MSAIRHALSVKRADDFAQWYQEVVSAADLAEESGVRGCMVIKPWGWGIWERIQHLMDARIKAAGVQNCYFPIFIPLANFEREAEHVEGFAKEMAVVTHHRLIADENGKLVGESKPTGFVPKFYEDLQYRGIKADFDIFHVDDFV